MKSEIAHVIELEFPIQRGESETITKLEFKRAKGKHLKVIIQGDGQDAMLRLACKLSGQPSDVFDELDSTDFFKVIKYMGELLAPLETGKAVSE